MELILKYFPELSEKQTEQFHQLDALYHDWNQLCEYMIDYNIGVFTANTFEVKRIDIDFFESEE